MEILKLATAGTLESSDVLIEVAPGSGSRNIKIKSVVLEQFGDALHAVVGEMLDRYGVENVDLAMDDRGALECTVKARLETVLRRGGGQQ